VYHELMEYGITPLIADPQADAQEAMHEYGIEFVDMDSIMDMDAVILAVAHDEFKSIDITRMDAFFGDGQKVLWT